MSRLRSAVSVMNTLTPSVVRCVEIVFHGPKGKPMQEKSQRDLVTDLYEMIDEIKILGEQTLDSHQTVKDLSYALARALKAAHMLEAIHIYTLNQGTETKGPT